MTEPEHEDGIGGGPPAPRHRLDPERAAAEAAGAPLTGDGEPQVGEGSTAAAQTFDPRPYRWMIGIFGLLLVLVISVYQFVERGIGTVGVPAGKQLHYFSAPLANSTLNGDANLTPPCAEARHDPRAFNVCLVVGRTPLVLAFFVTGSNVCERQVNTLQTLAGRFPPGTVTFAAVAVHASHADAAAAVRSHRWTIPVAYDRDGAVGAFYGVETCPIVELAYRGGIVADRLVGDHWASLTALAPKVRALLGTHR